MKSSGNNRTLLLAMLVAAAAAVAAYMFVGSSGGENTATLPAPTQVPSSAVLVAKQDLAAATVLTADMLEVKQVPTDAKNERALTDPDQAIGKVASVALMRGEQILDLRVESQAAEPKTFAYEVPVGKRAVSVVYDEVIGAGALVQPHDRVDVIGYFVMTPYDLEAEAGAAEGEFVVSVETAQVLSEPTADAEVVIEVEQDTEVTVLGAEGRYLRVRVDGEEGWIDGASIAAKPAEGNGTGGGKEPKKLPESHIVTFVVQNVEVLAVAQALTSDQAGVDGQATAPTPIPEVTADDEGIMDGADDDEKKPVARPSAKSATLALSPEEAQRLLLAVQEKNSFFKLALRSPGDTTITSLPPAEVGVVPMGDSVMAFNTPQFPTELVITHTEFTKRILNSGEMLDFKVTVKNVSDRTIRAAKDAPPEFTYTQGVAYDQLGFFPEPDTYRIGLNMAGAYPTQFPYRWSLGRDLEPGQTLDLAGSVQLTEATEATRYWFGVILEDDVVVQDGVGVADVTVLASSALSVKDATTQLRKDPNAQSSVVLDLEQGAELTVLEGRGAWFRVRVGNNEGWIPAASVEADPATVAGEPTTPAGDPELVAERIRERFDPWNREND